jgi:phosphotransferase system HPr-like phosphotransfer protein
MADVEIGSELARIADLDGEDQVSALRALIEFIEKQTGS